MKNVVQVKGKGKITTMSDVIPMGSIMEAFLGRWSSKAL